MGFGCLRGCCAVLVSLLFGGLSVAVCLVPLLSVGCLSVRPFGCPGGCGGLVWGGLLPLIAFPLSLSLALAVLGRSFAVPCRFRWWGGVFACPLLFVAIWGV